ncbi:hypothetical protein R3P38DRAFT_3222947 [Favolaschia claudopus]|uniref:Uncharacterized protein n=1 Tax=Favolaschia claudopus TaxID=2862362 RepID=A0AAV9ZXP1_9AGAR
MAGSHRRASGAYTNLPLRSLVPSYIVRCPLLRADPLNASADLTDRTRKALAKNRFGATFAVAPPTQFRFRNAPGSTPLRIKQSLGRTEVRRPTAVLVPGLTAGVDLPSCSGIPPYWRMLCPAGVSSRAGDDSSKSVSREMLSPIEHTFVNLVRLVAFISASQLTCPLSSMRTLKSIPPHAHRRYTYIVPLISHIFGLSHDLDTTAPPDTFHPTVTDPSTLRL